MIAISRLYRHASTSPFRGSLRWEQRITVAFPEHEAYESARKSYFSAWLATIGK